jgi:hypothetical protein
LEAGNTEMKYIIIFILSLLSFEAFAQKTSSYIFYDTSLFDKAVDRTKKALGEENVSVMEDAGIGDYVKKIQKDLANGKIKPGEQVMLQIYTHGAPNKGNEKSHRLNIKSEDNNMDDMIPLIRQLEEAGVKVALLDGSCFSGNSLSLSTPKTCVISSQSAAFEASAAGGAEHATFMDLFWHQRLAHGPSTVSDTFFSTRDEARTVNNLKNDRPEISEPFYMAIREDFNKWFKGHQLKYDHITGLFEELSMNEKLLKHDRFYCDLDYNRIFNSSFLNDQTKAGSSSGGSSSSTGINDLTRVAILNAFENIRSNLMEYYQVEHRLREIYPLKESLIDQYQSSDDEKLRDKLRYEKISPLQDEEKQKRDRLDILEQQIFSHEKELYGLLKGAQQEKSPCSSFNF